MEVRPVPQPVGRRDPSETEVRPAPRPEVRRGLSATAVRPDLLTVVVRRVLRPAPRLVLPWERAVRCRVLEMVKRPVRRAIPVRALPVRVLYPAPARFPLACPEHPPATADAAASSGA
jgi:hypothetical protein